MEKMRNRALFERMFYLQVLQKKVNFVYMAAVVPEGLRTSAFPIIVENALL